jgi:hypothetical protein
MVLFHPYANGADHTSQPYFASGLELAQRDWHA